MLAKFLLSKSLFVSQKKKKKLRIWWQGNFFLLSIFDLWKKGIALSQILLYKIKIKRLSPLIINKKIRGDTNPQIYGHINQNFESNKGFGGFDNYWQWTVNWVPNY